jgi:hypothetical protein
MQRKVEGRVVPAGGADGPNAVLGGACIQTTIAGRGGASRQRTNAVLGGAKKEKKERYL